MGGHGRTRKGMEGRGEGSATTTKVVGENSDSRILPRRRLHHTGTRHRRARNRSTATRMPRARTTTSTCASFSKRARRRRASIQRAVCSKAWTRRLACSHPAPWVGQVRATLCVHFFLFFCFCVNECLACVAIWVAVTEAASTRSEGSGRWGAARGTAWDRRNAVTTRRSSRRPRCRWAGRRPRASQHARRSKVCTYRPRPPPPSRRVGRLGWSRSAVVPGSASRHGLQVATTDEHCSDGRLQTPTICAPGVCVRGGSMMVFTSSTGPGPLRPFGTEPPEAPGLMCTDATARPLTRCSLQAASDPLPGTRRL